MTQTQAPLFLIGKVHSSQGIKGAVYVFLHTENPTWFDDWNELVLTSTPESTDFVTYKILRKQEHGKQGKKGYVLELENIKDRNAAELLVKKSIWVPEDYVASKKGETIYLREILGFTVHDEARGELGPITGFASNGAQDLLRIDFKGVIYDVPFVKAFLKEMDFKNKKIMMDIPQGLLGDE